MKSLFQRHRSPKPFLAPFVAAGRFSRLSRAALTRMPAAAAPVAVTVVGGVALVAVLGLLLGREAPPPEPASAATPVAAAQPAPDAEIEKAAVTAAAPPEPEEPARIAADLLSAPVLEPENNPDPARTSSIPPAMPGAGVLVPPVPIAETEAEIAELEAVQRREVEEDVGAPSPEETASVRADTPPMRPATATKYVNMRSGPSDNAEVLEVVPALAEIEAEAGCNWCAVSYEGRTGYIYKSFISYAD